jgi:chloramphenicol-sensitive protein RarD
MEGRASRPAQTEATRGVVAVVAAYVIWGFLPLYFVALEPMGPWEVVAWRVLATFLTCAIAVVLLRRARSVLEVARRPRALALLALAALAIYANWQFFLLGAALDQIVEVSLGYFMNPIVTALLARLVLGERLRPAQWTALVVCAAAVAVLVAGYGHVPWIAIGITLSFSAYSLLKRIVGPSVGALEGVSVETAWLVPVAAVQLAVVAATGGLTIGVLPPGQIALVAAAGVITGTPLLLFAAGARRIGLVTTALAQFIAPLLAFLIGVLILGEHMPPERWVGFGLVWLAALVVSVDLVVRAGGRRHPRASARRAHRLAEAKEHE